MPCPPPSLLSRAHPVHMPIASLPPHALTRLPGRTSSRATCPLFHSTQGAAVFNQPLSFDTSKVTNMHRMLFVRSARAPAPTALSRSLPVHAACVAATQRPHASRAAPHRASHARLSTRQWAYKFNQPLSFDTSKVTNMHQMFYVRSARALPPTHAALNRTLPVHADCVAPTPRPHASRPAPHRASHARLSARQGVTAFNQPLSFDTSKVTDMGYMFDVSSARALTPTALTRALPVHADCVAATHSALTPPGPHLFSHRMPAFRLGSARTRSTSRSASTRPRSRP